MIFSPPFLRCLTLVLWPFHKGFRFLLHKFHFLGFLLHSFLRTLFGLSSWCPSRACPLGVPVWRVPWVSQYGVFPWCSSMACSHGVPVWRVPLVFQYGVSPWCSSMACHYGVPVWPFPLVSQYGVSPWCPSMACLLVFVLIGFQCIRNAAENDNR